MDADVRASPSSQLKFKTYAGKGNRYGERSFWGAFAAGSASGNLQGICLDWVETHKLTFLLFNPLNVLHLHLYTTEPLGDLIMKIRYDLGFSKRLNGIIFIIFRRSVTFGK